MPAKRTLRPGAATRSHTKRRQRSRVDDTSLLRASAGGGSSVPEVLKALRDAGIKDLEDLVGHVIGKAQSEPEALDLFAPAKTAPEAEYLHRPPKIAFTVAGVTYDPRDIKRFDGQPLHFVSRRAGNKDRDLIGFIGNDWVRAIGSYFQMQQLAGIVAPPATGAGGSINPATAYYTPGSNYWDPYPGKQKGAVAAGIPPGHEVPSLVGRVYQHANFQGDRLRINGLQQCSDLTLQSRGFLGLGDWNDIISSVQTDGATLLLFEHIHYAGDTLLVLPSDNLNNLADVGWNDRVSSLKNFGAVY